MNVKVHVLALFKKYAIFFHNLWMSPCKYVTKTHNKATAGGGRNFRRCSTSMFKHNHFCQVLYISKDKDSSTSVPLLRSLANLSIKVFLFHLSDFSCISWMYIVPFYIGCFFFSFSSTEITSNNANVFHTKIFNIHVFLVPGCSEPDSKFHLWLHQD